MALETHNPFDLIDKRLNLIQSLLIEIKTPINLPVKSESDQYLDQKEVSKVLGVSTVTIWDWEKKGILQSYRIGNLKRFKLSEVMSAPTPIKRADAISKK